MTPHDAGGQTPLRIAVGSGAALAAGGQDTSRWVGAFVVITCESIAGIFDAMRLALSEE